MQHPIFFWRRYGRKSSSKQAPRRMAQRRWRSHVKRGVIVYLVLCVVLYFQQQRLMFFPFKQIKHTPSLYDLTYDEVWIPVSTQTEHLETLHSWWIPDPDPNAPVFLYCHHNAANIGANVSQALQFYQLGYSVF
ncbi:MAG: hypothetical protein F6K09_32330, partial [Merismopedia sp. SIO2A8]|nr:hypothetical protein [Merismopedia sp. SIO2A8]